MLNNNNVKPGGAPSTASGFGVTGSISGTGSSRPGTINSVSSKRSTGAVTVEGGMPSSITGRSGTTASAGNAISSERKPLNVINQM